MKKKIEEIIELPAGISADLKNTEITLKGKGKELKRVFIEHPKIKTSVEGSKIKIACEKTTKKEMKLIGSFVAHMKNMIHGIEEDYLYKLEICNVHFPMTVKVEGDKFKIKNFLGEKIERVAMLCPNTKVNVKGNIIEVSSADIEKAGQTAANIEIAAKIRNRDRRVFQDGIFIIEKPGRQ